jgi:hypothetical protein
MSKLLDAKHRLMPYIYTHVGCLSLMMDYTLRRLGPGR